MPKSTAQRVERDTAKPAGNDNSIEAAAFVFGFTRPFNAGEIQNLASLQSALSTELPSYQLVNSLSFDVSSGGSPGKINVGVNGVILQNFLPSGKPSWTLRASENNIVISCQTYDHWETVWAKAKGFLSQVTKILYCADNPLNMLSLQVVDKFVYERMPSEYDISDVFNTESSYLTKHVVKDAGALWHVNQGWFKDTSVLDTSVKLLNVLNVMSTNSGDELHSIVDHTSQIFLKDSANLHIPDPDELCDVAFGQIDEIFCIFHDGNKAVLKEVLCAKKLKEIGL